MLLSLFGKVKHNKAFKRLRLCGIDIVEIETLLISIAHNLAKMNSLKAA